MDMKVHVTTKVDQIPDDPGFAPRFDQLREACAAGAAGAGFEKLLALHQDADTFIESLKRGLFRAPLAWNSEQKAAARWISLQHHRLARNARRVAELLMNDAGASPERKALATALALHHLSEAMKFEMADDPRATRHFRSLHALMRAAIASGFERLEISVQVQAAQVRCTVESLFFRALLLARSSGVLSNSQVEILDSWFWLWIPTLQGSAEMPAGASLRVDLDSDRGLRRSGEVQAAHALYLPMLPLERAFHAIVEQFQNGVIVPSKGHASRFRMEEHMVVLDMARRTLRGMRREPVTRASREPSSVMAELHVGIAEIMSRGARAPVTSKAPVRLLALEGSGAPQPRREDDNPIAGIYDINRRNVRVIDVSASGIGLEGALPECSEVAVGDIVALRLSPDGPLELGKVARRAFPAEDGRVVIGVHLAPTTGRVVIGVRQLSPAVQYLDVVQGSKIEKERHERMLFVPGGDSSGRHDAFLVTESTMLRGQAFEAQLGDQTFSFRLNRVRDRGRGWMLAGFEIFGMEKRGPVKAAA